MRIPSSESGMYIRSFWIGEMFEPRLENCLKKIYSQRRETDVAVRINLVSKSSESDGLGAEVDDDDDFLLPMCDFSGIMFRCRMMLPSPFFLRAAPKMDKHGKVRQFKIGTTMNKSW